MQVCTLRSVPTALYRSVFVSDIGSWWHLLLQLHHSRCSTTHCTVARSNLAVLRAACVHYCALVIAVCYGCGSAAVSGALADNCTTLHFICSALQSSA
jgi:hypothetical protein